MNVYQRPLFRNMGGPVAPAPMAPQPMPAQAAMGGQDPMALMQAAEQVASEQTQGLGAEYAQSMINNLDAAETPEDVINAIRGNQMPLESRYRELAEYVGEEDAGQTPQSVLALVQPTLMMTEEGAMNSGIGELMQNITGEVEMITEEGLPTDMGQGVGSLMMSGVGQQPVANFSQGGFVQRFQEGGEASRLQQIYSEMLPVYQSIMGDGSDARRMTQSQILFDIADRAAAFAGGVDPRTGQSVAGASPAAQLGVAMTGLGGTIGSRLAAQDEQDRALRLAALQAAQGEYSAERAAARASSGRERGIGDAFEIVGPDGQIIDTVRLRTQDDFDRVQSEYPDALIREAREPVDPTFNAQTFFGPNGEVVTINVGTAEGMAQANNLLSQEYTDQEPPTPEGTVRLYNPNNLENVQLVEENSTEMRQAYQMGFRTLEEIKSLSDLQAPAELPSAQVVTIYPPEVEGQPAGQPVTLDVSNPDQRSRLNELTAEGWTDQAPADTTPSTLTERQQAAITEQETLDNLENLSPQQLSRFATTAAAFIQETTSPAGTTSRLPLPPNTQEAMRRAHAAGVSFPGIDPSLFGAAPRADELQATALEILDPTTNLSAATGILSGLQRGINFLGEQASEIIGGEGTMFKDTAQGSSALNALAAATRRFYLDGRTLALEFSLLQEELVRPSLLRTDGAAVRALSNQRDLLQGDLERLQALLDNPRGYSNADISRARQMSTYANQLLATYDEFIDAYNRQEGPVPEDRREQILNDPRFSLNPQE